MATSFGKNWDDKLRLLNAIDDMRTPARPQTPAHTPIHESEQALREKLSMYEKTCAMLEQEVQDLEQQTMAALAEAGRLRRELDANKARSIRNEGFLDYVEKDKVHKIITESENERRLLLDALESSEAELARMVRTLDVVARKLQVA